MGPRPGHPRASGRRGASGPGNQPGLLPGLVSAPCTLLGVPRRASGGVGPERRARLATVAAVRRRPRAFLGASGASGGASGPPTLPPSALGGGETFLRPLPTSRGPLPPFFLPPPSPPLLAWPSTRRGRKFLGCRAIGKRRRGPVLPRRAGVGASGGPVGVS